MKPAAPDHALAEQPDEALQSALRALLVPLARLAVDHGLPFAAVEEVMKQAFVACAAEAHPGLLAHRKVSRISTVTGINRREVTRLTRASDEAPQRKASVASEIYARWLTDAAYQDARGRPLVLPRQGAAPSFESLAQAVTRDVHPRGLLDELLRLKLGSLDADSDCVSLAADATPRGDAARMLGFLGDNVGDHLQAAVANVLGGAEPHFDQAMFADGLSDDTMVWLRQTVRERWRTMLAEMVPALEQRLADDAKADPVPTRRWRLGLYSYDEPVADTQPVAAPAALASSRSASPTRARQSQSLRQRPSKRKTPP